MHRRLRRAALLAAAVALAPNGPTARGDAGPGARSALRWEGSATLDGVNRIGRKDLTVRLRVVNPGEQPVEVLEANLLLAGDGGWLTPLDPESLDGGFLRGRLAVPPATEKFIGDFEFHPFAPAAWALLSGRADDGPFAVAWPLLHAGHAPPPPYAAPEGLSVGLSGPLEILPFADGRRGVLVIGQVQALQGPRPEEVRVEALLGDGGGTLEPVHWEGLGPQPDRERLWPFVRRIDVPDAFVGGTLRLGATAKVGGEPAAFRGEWPVRLAEPVTVLGPVLGAWQLGNGPGQRDLHANYRSPEWRYSYDFVVVEQGRTYRGEPHKRESYFAWNRSVRAVAAGTVRDACDREVDNPGLGTAPGFGRSDCQVNRVVIGHDDGTFSVYLHLRQRSIVQGVQPGNRVEAGQVIARVGNSGGSTEPHLHLVIYRLDASGRPQPVPMRFANAYEDPAGERPVGGVPVGGRPVVFIDR